MVEKIIRARNNQEGIDSLRNYVLDMIKFKWNRDVEFSYLICKALFQKAINFNLPKTSVVFSDDYNIEVRFSLENVTLTFNSENLHVHYDELYNAEKARFGIRKKNIKLPNYDDYVKDFINHIHPILECDIEENGIENCSFLSEWV